MSFPSGTFAPSSQETQSQNRANDLTKNLGPFTSRRICTAQIRFNSQVPMDDASSSTTSLPGCTISAPQVGQMSGDSAASLAPSTDPSSSQFALLLQEALIELSKRTKVDLFTDAGTKQLMQCNSVNEITAILQARIDAFTNFRNSDIKVQLISKLIPFVTTVLALHPKETPGEGFGVMIQPAKAIIGAAGALSEAPKGVSSSYDGLVELLDCITRLLARLDVHTKMPLSPAMETILVKTLIHIKQGRLVAYIRRLMGNPDVESALRKLERLNVEEAQMTGVQTFQLVYSLVNSLNETMKNERGVLHQYRTWLSPPDPSTNHNIALDHYHESRGRWLLESEQGRQWKVTTSLLWIQGKPLQSSRTSNTSAESGLKLSWHTSTAIFEILRDRIFATQLNVCTKILNSLYTRNDEGGQPPTESELIRCLKEMLQQILDYSIYIVIDALDECAGSGTSSSRKRVLELIARIIEWRIPNMHMCLTSRPESEIKGPHLSARDVLKNLPTTLDETYRRTLRNVSPEYASRLFQFLVACLRPLHISELAELLAMDYGSSTLPQVRGHRRLPDPE
ncbi:hypothetical protein CERSUDRAFT_73309 [Gelatoporia subvermispora B]|uniref:Uncharacterized protein n=1 Tax=Ceriporiopsis subvermispora (strain B) TaxID=914234 RepID=M2QK74_CERS8|nr:hypothetical protein CERSUDRAFT_73309 [Gelatoporia subvermispora B]